MEQEFQAAFVQNPAGELALQKALFRCSTCLSTYYVKGDEKVRYWYPCLVCELPGALARFVGWLNNGRIKETYSVDVCDASCNTARGDECMCKCGGANHGLGFIATYQYDRDKGAAPKQLTIDKDKAIAEALEWRAEVARVLALTADDRKARRDGAWIDRGAYMRIVGHDKALNAARQLNTHKGRMKKLAPIGKEWI